MSGIDFIPPGGTFQTEAEDEEGVEHYQCCIHPCMRLDDLLLSRRQLATCKEAALVARSSRIPGKNVEVAQDVRIRPARLDEHALLESLQRRSSLNNPGDRDALLAHPDAIVLPLEQIRDGCVFVAEHDGIVAGFAAVVPRDDGGAELDALFVEPHLWRRGIGRRLVDHAAAIARARSAHVLHVIGNPHAEGFYSSCGFRATGTVDTQFGPGLEMQRPLH